MVSPSSVLSVGGEPRAPVRSDAWPSTARGILICGAHPRPWCKLSHHSLHQLVHEIPENLTMEPLSLESANLEQARKNLPWDEETKRK